LGRNTIILMRLKRNKDRLFANATYQNRMNNTHKQIT